MTSKAELLYSELLDMFEEAEFYTENDVKTHIYCLLKETVKHPQNTIHILNSIEEERIENKKCPKCNENLESIPHNQFSEYQGSECCEVTYSQRCPDCGWDSDKD